MCLCFLLLFLRVIVEVEPPKWFEVSFEVYALQEVELVTVKAVDVSVES